ncbi:hypothetical protein BaRGS_00013419 [Batillaria attramentaria]|uniref:Uncharacterized protein n=1 Tax=Batillaria attramentaria TaxID=370345 RepID=A0ABD0L7U5_9CAEN
MNGLAATSCEHTHSHNFSTKTTDPGSSGNLITVVDTARGDALLPTLRLREPAGNPLRVSAVAARRARNSLTAWNHDSAVGNGTRLHRTLARYSVAPTPIPPLRLQLLTPSATLPQRDMAYSQQPDGPTPAGLKINMEASEGNHNSEDKLN